MASSFRGTYVHKLDGKGRVAVPSAFRDVLRDGDPVCPAAGEAAAPAIQPRAVLVSSVLGYPCLDGYTIAGMDALEARALATDDLDHIEFFKEEVAGRSVEVQLDDTGRLLIGRALREALGLSDEAIFIGKLDRFEIWEPGARAAFEADQKAQPDRQALRQAMMRRLMGARPRAQEGA